MRSVSHFGSLKLCPCFFYYATLQLFQIQQTLSVLPLPSAALCIPIVVLKHKCLEKLPEEALQYMVWLKGTKGIISIYLTEQCNRNLKLIQTKRKLNMPVKEQDQNPARCPVPAIATYSGSYLPVLSFYLGYFIILKKCLSRAEFTL